MQGCDLQVARQLHVTAALTRLGGEQRCACPLAELGLQQPAVGNQAHAQKSAVLAATAKLPGSSCPLITVQGVGCRRTRQERKSKQQNGVKHEVQATLGALCGLPLTASPKKAIKQALQCRPVLLEWTLAGVHGMLMTT
jgi:hypothetical protein